MFQGTDGTIHGQYIDANGDCIHWWKDASGYHLANVNANAPEAAQDPNKYRAGAWGGPYTVNQGS